MSQQELDLRRSMQILRRRKLLVGLVVLLGLLAGGAYGKLYPPVMTSTALVVLPPPPQNSQATGTGAPDPYTATQEVIAGSNPVLTNALPGVHPTVSLAGLRREILIGSVTPYVISITAKGNNAADTEATANAVASSYVQYVNAVTNAAEHVPAVSLERATAAAGASPLKGLVVDALAGGIVGGLVGAVLAIAIGRRDRRLRERDEIADTIGVPVLASVPVTAVRDPAGWIKLLETYEPRPRQALQLRQALRYLGLAAYNSVDGYDTGAASVMILSLSSDPKAIALGPQLATFAAASGFSTLLVIGPQQDPNVAATLRTACSAPPGSSNWPSQLRVTVSDGPVDVSHEAALTVVVCVVDGRTPRIPAGMRTGATLLAVSSGVATAEQLARVAVTADGDSGEISGILVADPEPTDSTTGRIPALSRPAHRRLPTRLRGVTTEIRR
jgi:capsular polysaccharide biosynthesis protein